MQKYIYLLLIIFTLFFGCNSQLSDNLEVALKVISETEESRIAVVKDYKNFAFIGYVTKADVVEAYNKALLESRHKEHGD